MKTTTQELKEKAFTYGYQAMEENELIKLTGYKGSDFFNSQNFKAFKELTRRQEYTPIKKIHSSKDAYKHLSFLEGIDHEQFWVMFLKKNNTIIKTDFISKGGATSCIIDVKLIMKQAVLQNAQSIILCHNHPSGELKPSDADKTLTERVKNAAKFFEISVLDHIIIGDGKQSQKLYSFVDEGQL